MESKGGVPLLTPDKFPSIIKLFKVTSQTQGRACIAFQQQIALVIRIVNIMAGCAFKFIVACAEKHVRGYGSAGGNTGGSRCWICQLSISSSQSSRVVERNRMGLSQIGSDEAVAADSAGRDSRAGAASHGIHGHRAVMAGQTKLGYAAGVAGRCIHGSTARIGLVSGGGFSVVPQRAVRHAHGMVRGMTGFTNLAGGPGSRAEIMI